MIVINPQKIFDSWIKHDKNCVVVKKIKIRTIQLRLRKQGGCPHLGTQCTNNKFDVGLESGSFINKQLRD